MTEDIKSCPTRILAIEIPVELAEAMIARGLAETLHAVAIALTPAGCEVIRGTIDGFLADAKGVA